MRLTIRRYSLLLPTLLLVLLAKPVMASEEVPMERERQFLYYFYEAERLIQTERLNEAWELVQFCAELNPNDATINNYIGCFLEAMQRKQEARTYFERAYQGDPDSFWYRYILLLLTAENEADTKTAIRELENVSTRLTKDNGVHQMLQKAYVATGDFKKALALQDRLDSINGYTATSAVQRYRLNMLLNRQDEALAQVERYLTIDPDEYELQLFRMQLYEQTKQPAKKMIAAYEDVLRLNPRNPLVLNNLAWYLCTNGGDLERAEALSRMAIMAEPSNAVYLDTYAWIMYLKKDYESAYFYINRAVGHADEETVSKEIEKHHKQISRHIKKK